MADFDDGVVVDVVAFGFFGGRPRGRGCVGGGGVSTFDVGGALGFFGGRPRGRGVVVVEVVLTVVDVDKRVEGNAVLLLLVPPRRARLPPVAVSVGLA